MNPGPTANHDRVRIQYARTLSLATLALVLLTWPLWSDVRSYPRVPFVRDWPSPLLADRGWQAAALASTLSLAAIAARWRFALMPAIVVACFAVLGDQDRLQPWVYQFFVVGTALAFAPPDWGVRFAGWFHVTMYVHSGLSKLDWSFAHQLGPALLSVPARAIGAIPSHWPEASLVALSLAMPASEVVLGCLLVTRRLRTLGLGLAMALHVGIVAILGPWGLDHGASVLVWNIALLIEELILFRPGAAPDRIRWKSLPVAVAVGFAAVVVMPFFERLGLWDTWPSFAVYASHNERAEVYVHSDDRDSWPTEIRPHVLDLGQGPWLRLDLLAWSRAARGVPPYPQVRASLGVARALLRGDRPPRMMRIVVLGRADRWTGRRDVDTIHGREALEQRLRRYWLNAWPARSAADSPRSEGASNRKESPTR